MRIATITATNGKRPHLFNRSMYYLKRQTVRIDAKIYMPQSNGTLKEKYKDALESLEKAVDLVFFIEDDDYYPPNYIGKMLELYEWAGRPEIFGIGETWFYHPELKAYWYYKNQEHNACAFCTCVRTDALHKLDWNQIDDVFVDAGLWKQLEGNTVELGKPLPIGIKHGRGKTLADGHTRWFYEEKSKFSKGSDDFAVFSDTWLRETIGEDAEFYEEFGRNINLI